MPDRLTALPGRDFINEVKLRIRDDEAWAPMVAPVRVEKTRWALTRLIDNIDGQLARVGDTDDARWIAGITALRGSCQRRLDALPPAPTPRLSNNKETRAWRGFAARLAEVIEEIDPEVLDELKAPYGAMTARQWLKAREEKKQ